MVTRAYLRNARRSQLVAYLESWGYQCYARETTAELRKAAYLNFDTEGR